MKSLTVLALAILVYGCTSIPPKGIRASLGKVQPVTGFIDNHWEYPSFLPDNAPGYTALPFEFDIPKAQIIEYNQGILASNSRELAPCLRVAGKGYVTRRKPTGMWPANRKFVFTEVSTIKRLEGRSECDAR